MKQLEESVIEQRMDILSDMTADAISGGLRTDIVMDCVRVLIGGAPQASQVLSLAIQKYGTSAMFASAIASHVAQSEGILLTQLKKSS